MNVVLDLIFKPTLIVLCAAMIVALLRRSSASLRHAVWILAITSAVILPLVSAVVPQVELPVALQTTASGPLFSLETAAVVGTSPGFERGGKPSSAAQPSGDFRLLMVWLSGVVVVLSRLLAGAIAVRRTAMRAVPLADDGWRQIVGELSRSLGIRRPVRLVFGGPGISPMTWGIVRHIVLLPSTAAQWSDDRRRLVLAHELAHVKRMDGAIQILVQAVCGIYWFNPLVWCAAYRLRIERERACDDSVLSLGTAAADYADHLLQIVRGMRTQRAFAFAAVSMGQPSQLETRLVSILDGRLRRRKLSRVGAALLCTFAVLLTLSVAVLGVAAAVPLPPVLAAALRLAPDPLPAEPAAKPAAGPQRTRIGTATIPNSAVIPPRVVSSKPPIYTSEALSARIEGIVTLEAAVDLEGRIRILRVVKELGYGLDQRAIGSVLDWKFAAATRNGVPIESVTQIDVEFKLPPQNPLQLLSLVSILKGNGIEAPTVEVHFKLK